MGLGDWLKYGAAAVAGGPLGLLGMYGHDQQQAGNDAQNASMGQARDQLAQLKKDQYAQRQKDIDRALSFFGPADDLMYQMYGVRPASYIAPENRQTRTGPGHFGAIPGGGPPPPPPPAPPDPNAAAAAAMFTPGAKSPGAKGPWYTPVDMTPRNSRGKGGF